MDSWFTSQMAVAMVGGVTVNLLNLLELQRVPRSSRPDLRDPLIWASFLCWPLLAGLVVFLYDEQAQSFNRLVSFQVGISAPLILRALAGTIPTQVKLQLPPGA